MTLSPLISAALAGTLALVSCGATPRLSQESQKRGALLGKTLIHSYTQEQMQGLLDATHRPLKATNGIDLYKVRYATVDTDGTATVASGLVAMPQGSDTAPPVVVYQHGTIVERGAAPSAGPLGEGGAIALLFVSSGYAVIAADYLGFGDNPGFHPYLHAATEASAARDLMRAARKIDPRLNAGLDRRLFVCGYSQGGHAAMALLKDLQTSGKGEFKVTAAAPMAGPYALSKTVQAVGDAPPSANTVVYAADIVTSYSRIYHHSYGNGSAYQAAYAGKVDDLFDGKHSFAAIAGALPDRVSDLFKPEFLQDVKNNPRNQLIEDLRKNDNDDWKPTCPVRLYHASGDRDVPILNSQLAYEHMKARGADVTLIDLGDKSHGQAVEPALLGAKTWFDTLR